MLSGRKCIVVPAGYRSMRTVLGLLLALVGAAVLFHDYSHDFLYYCQFASTLHHLCTDDDLVTRGRQGLSAHKAFEAGALAEPMLSWSGLSISQSANPDHPVAPVFSGEQSDGLPSSLSPPVPVERFAATIGDLRSLLLRSSSDLPPPADSLIADNSQSPALPFDNFVTRFQNNASVNFQEQSTVFKKAVPSC